MNKKIKRSTALIIAALCMCSSFSANSLFTGKNQDQKGVFRIKAGSSSI